MSPSSPFSKQTIINYIIDGTNQHQDPALSFGDLNQILFTMKFYISDPKEASTALNSYDSVNGFGSTLNAIQDTYDYLIERNGSDIIRTYEELPYIYNNDRYFWKTPQIVASKLAYCIGDFYMVKALNAINEDYDTLMSPDTVTCFITSLKIILDNDKIHFAN